MFGFLANFSVTVSAISKLDQFARKLKVCSVEKLISSKLLTERKKKFNEIKTSKQFFFYVKVIFKEIFTDWKYSETDLLQSCKNYRKFTQWFYNKLIDFINKYVCIDYVSINYSYFTYFRSKIRQKAILQSKEEIKDEKNVLHSA